jgi:TonB family protein
VEQVKTVFYKDFSPFQGDPTLSAVAWVWVDPNGVVLRHQLHTSSGDGSFDAAVERAIRLVKSVPSPPSSLVTGGDLRLDLVFRMADS